MSATNGNGAKVGAATVQALDNGSPSASPNAPPPEFVLNEEAQRRLEGAYAQMIHNEVISRAQLMSKILDAQGRDIDKECGYPEVITPQMYRRMYDRNGIAKTLTDLWPSESYSVDPVVYEVEDEEETEFEEALKSLSKSLAGDSWMEEQETNLLWSYLYRASCLAGIGRFGILLIGIGDGKELSEPAAGIDDNGKWTPERPTGSGENGRVPLLHLTPLDESMVQIGSYETNRSSPRYRMPKTYLVSLVNDSEQEAGLGSSFGSSSLGEEGSTGHTDKVTVHWSRVVHLVRNRGSSEVFGAPEMEDVFNYLLDLRKIGGGSGEMFWSGAFMGLAAMLHPDLAGQSLNLTAMREALWRRKQGLQRDVIGEGFSVDSIAPQVSDPSKHVDMNLGFISIAKRIPRRLLSGSERGELASSQDERNWKGRVGAYQRTYTTPYEVRPVIDRFIALGILPEPEQYYVWWPDMYSLSDEEKAKIAKDRIEGLTKYIAGHGEQMVGPKSLLTTFSGWGFTGEEAESMLEEAAEFVEEKEAEEAEKRAEELEAAQEAGLIPAPGQPGTPNAPGSTPTGPNAGSPPNAPSGSPRASGASGSPFPGTSPRAR